LIKPCFYINVSGSKSPSLEKSEILQLKIKSKHLRENHKVCVKLISSQTHLSLVDNAVVGIAVDYNHWFYNLGGTSARRNQFLKTKRFNGWF